jgi:signal peptidase I
MAGNKRRMPAIIFRQSPKRRSKDQAAETRSGWASTGRFILLLAIFAWALRSFLFQPFYIPSASMLPTLYIGDYLIVAKWPFGYSEYSFPFTVPPFHGRILSHVPARGDVVVFRHPTENADLIKRVIGLPGDTVELRSGQLILNGKPVRRQALPPYSLPVSANTPCSAVPPASPILVRVGNRAYCVFPAFRETLPGGRNYTIFDQTATEADDFPPTRVPAGHVFLMGDNRDDSLDSRFPTATGGIGMVPLENLIGRAEITFWSTDGTASWWKPWTWFSALRLERLGNRYTAGAQ